MNAAYTHVRQALTGVLHMLIGRTDFHARFDVSSKGVAASFSAAILVIPFSAFVVLVVNTLARLTAGELDGGVEPMSLAYVVARWAASWSYFPLLAVLLTTLLDRGAYFAPWVVLHNWTHLFVAMLQVVPYALIVSGFYAVGEMLLLTSIVILAYAYVAAAKAALDISWRTAIACGCANIACAMLIEAGLQEVL